MRYLYIEINLIKTLVMGCGCKNKGNQQAAAAPQQQVSTQNEGTKNQTVQESVKKIVERYYNNKK